MTRAVHHGASECLGNGLVRRMSDAVVGACGNRGRSVWPAMAKAYQRRLYPRVRRHAERDIEVSLEAETFDRSLRSAKDRCQRGKP